MNSIKGIPISPGIAIGKAYFIKEVSDEIDCETGKNKEEEIERYKQAREEAVKQIMDIYNNMVSSNREKEAVIFLAHKEILEDIEFISSVEHMLSDTGCSAEWAVKVVRDQYFGIFDSMGEEYMRERAIDISDVGIRLIRILQGKAEDDYQKIEESVILIGRELTPSDTAQLNPKIVLGIINEEGGATSHAAIIARMLGIPFVICPNIISTIKNGQMLAMDGESGLVELELDETVFSVYNNKKELLDKKKVELQDLIGTKSITKDNFEIKLAGNIGLPRDVENVLSQDGDSIGLFRTEFLFMDRDNLPSEEEQFLAYKDVVQAMKGNPVIIRTLDIGGDKELSYLKIPKEENPFLGCRAIRFCLKRIPEWKTQLRSLLRASAYGNVQIMFPMLVSISELKKAKDILEEVKFELRKEGIKFNEKLPVGMMMETPAAAIMADAFAKEVDFFSIGTNDLTQYTLAVDRMNKEVAHLYSPYDPAVLRLIKCITDSAHKYGIWVGICGEAAAEKKLLPIWTGLGVDELSMSPGSILESRKRIQKMTKFLCEKVVLQVMELDNAADIETLLKDYEDDINGE